MPSHGQSVLGPLDVRALLREGCRRLVCPASIYERVVGLKQELLDAEPPTLQPQEREQLQAMCIAAMPDRVLEKAEELVDAIWGQG